MYYAFSDVGEKVTATPYRRAICPNCKAAVIAKCGDLNVWHWAHEYLGYCDSWQYEAITQWHLDWQAHFSLDNVEVFITKGDKIHRADIRGRGKKIIEIQNSPISVSEIFEREQFYENMCWIINTQKFKHNLSFKEYKVDYEKDVAYYIEADSGRQGHYIIRVPCLWSKEIITSLKENGFYPCDEDDYEEEFWEHNKPIVKGEMPKDIVNAFKNYLLDEKLKERLDWKKNYKTIFTWKRLTRSWLDAKQPRLLDLNNGFLFYIQTLYENGNGFGEIISKRNFLSKYKI